MARHFVRKKEGGQVGRHLPCYVGLLENLPLRTLYTSKLPFRYKGDIKAARDFLAERITRRTSAINQITRRGKKPVARNNDEQRNLHKQQPETSIWVLLLVMAK